MSLPTKDRNFRAEAGKNGAGERDGENAFAVEIARALEVEYGGSQSKVKVVARLTRANEKTVKNWFAARNGPNGAGLVALMRHSDEVLGTVLRLARRDAMLAVAEARAARAELRVALVAALRLLDDPEDTPK